MKQIGDREVGILYARTLIAIARGDHDIEFEEGLRLADCIEARCTPPVPLLEDLLLEPPLLPDQLASHLGDRGGPFRGSSLHARELATMLVADGISVLLAKGYATDLEAERLWRFVEALGLSSDDFRHLTSNVARWFTSTGS